MAVNQANRAYLAWPVLIRQAKRGKRITYKELGDAVGSITELLGMFWA